MATKKVKKVKKGKVKKEKAVKEIKAVKKESETPKSERYFYAVGRRKTAIVKIKLYLIKSDKNELTINSKELDKYFPLSRLQEIVGAPLTLAGEGIKFKLVAKALGGGTNAQAEAMRLGISRALVLFNPELKKSLKDKGFLTRDPREVERKKPGLKKARRAPQWAKR